MCEPIGSDSAGLAESHDTSRGASSQVSAGSISVLQHPAFSSSAYDWDRGKLVSLSEFVEHIPVAVAVADGMAGVLLHANSQMEKLFGYDSGELTGKSVEALVPDDLAVRHRSLREGYMTAPGGPTPRNMGKSRLLVGKMKDGTTVPIEAGLNPLHMQNGFTLIMIAIVDISPLRRELLAAESRARKEQDRMRLLVEASPAGMILVDSEGCIQLANTSTVRMLGYDKTVLIGQPVEMLLPPHFRSRHEQLRNDFILAGKPGVTYSADLHRSVFGMRSDGTTFPAETTLQFVTMPGAADGHDDSCTLATVVDISDRVKAEEQARNADAQAIRSRGEAFTHMSHELRAPLHGVQGFIQLLQDTALTEEQVTLVNTIAQCSSRTLSVLNDVLDWAKLESGTLDIEPRQFDPWALLQQACCSCAHSASAAGVKVVCEALSSLPHACTADVARISQVLQQLIGNAVKFSERGGQVKLCMSGEPVMADVPPSPPSTRAYGGGKTGHSASKCAEIKKGGFILRCTVSDQGIGIDPDMTNGRIFEPLTRGDTSSTRKAEGTGLGLAIVKRLCNLMGGDINVTSTLGQGSTFTFHVFTGLDASIAPMACAGKRRPEWVRVCTASAQAQEPAHARDRSDSSYTLKTPRDPSLLSTSVERSAAESALRDTCTITGTGTWQDMHNEKAHRAHKRAVSGRPRLHSGRISVTASASGSSSTVSQPSSGTRSLESFVGGGKKPNILVVDDNSVNLRVAQSFVKKLGAVPLSANDGLQAVQAWIAQTVPNMRLCDIQGNVETLQKHMLTGAGASAGGDDGPRNNPPAQAGQGTGEEGQCAAESHSSIDAILLDCEMPVMNGFDCARCIRELEAAEGKGRHTPIIALTASAATADRAQCLAAGMDTVLPKPVSFAHLQTVLTEVMGKLQPEQAKNASDERGMHESGQATRE